MICQREGCEAEAEVEIRALDPEDPSGGRFCVAHGRLFLGSGEETGTEPPKVAVLVGEKRGLPDFSNVEASLHVSGVTAGHTEAEIDVLVAQGKIAFGKMAERVHEMIADGLRKRGW